jgi:hypothetical protein
MRANLFVTRVLAAATMALSFTWLVAYGGGGGAAPSDGARRASPAGDEAAVTHEFTGPGGSSRVGRRALPGGGERLWGETTLRAQRVTGGVRSFGAELGPQLETVSLDGSGRLISAEIANAGPLGERPARRIVLDGRAALVRIALAGGEPTEWRVPVDAPWVYRGTVSDDGTGAGALVSTPVAAWVALRAAAAAGSARVVRVLEPEVQRSYLVPIDQVLVRTEVGSTVILGGDGIDADDLFVTHVRLTDRAITLSRIEPPCDVAPSRPSTIFTLAAGPGAFFRNN